MITALTLQNSDEWNTIVTSFQQYDVYYLSNYVKAFQLHGDGEPLLLFYEDQEIRAINVVMKRDIANDSKFKGTVPTGMYYDFATPYGYGGFLIEGNITEQTIEQLNAHYSQYCAEQQIVSEIVRFHPVLNNKQLVEAMYEICPLGKTITVDVRSKELIWQNYNTNKKRFIKKAQQAGVKVLSGISPELFQRFQQMYTTTMQANDVKDYYYFSEHFYKSIMQDLADHTRIFYATYEDEMIAMVLVLFANGQVHHHFSASVPTYHHLAATNLVMYEIACWASDHQYKTFHMGGGVGSQQDSLYQFKHGFNKYSDTTFVIGKKIFNEQKYTELLKLREQKKPIHQEQLFFPLYRAQ